MGKTTNRKEIPSQRRRQILDAARELFSRRGYHGVTVDAIAELAGISKGNLYWHFKSKQDIFQMLFDDIAEHLTTFSENIMQSDALPQEKLRALTRHQLEVAEAYPEAVYLMLQISGQPELSDMVSSGYSMIMGQYIELLTPIFAAMGEESPQAVAILYITALDGLMAMAVMGKDLYDKEKIMSVIEERFIDFRRDGYV